MGNLAKDHLPNVSDSSLDTVDSPYNQKLTPTLVCSPLPMVPMSSSPLRLKSENLIPSRSTANVKDTFPYATVRSTSKQSSQKSSFGDGRPSPARSRTTSALMRGAGLLDNVDLNASSGEPKVAVKRDKIPSRLSFETSRKETLSIGSASTRREAGKGDKSTPMTNRSSGKHPIKRLIGTLRSQGSRRKKHSTISREQESLDVPEEKKTEYPNVAEWGKYKTSSTAASSFTTARGSNATSRSRKNRLSGKFSRSNMNSRFSQASNRASTDSRLDWIHGIDEPALRRADQRRRTLEELVCSEESYIADLKILLNVNIFGHRTDQFSLTHCEQAYFTLLASSSNVSQRILAQIHQNVSDILFLHEDILYQMKQVMSGSEIASSNGAKSRETNVRRSSFERPGVAPTAPNLVQTTRMSQETSRKAELNRIRPSVEPREVAGIARIFGRMMGRFFIYEEYGAKYELMLRDMTVTSKSITNWNAFERSIEALANSLASSNTNDDNGRKGLTFEDLLIKPIQRICKYPLLFEDLHRNTLEKDDSEARAEVDRSLTRLREITRSINKATNDRQTQARIQRTWHLQDILILPDVSTAPLSLRVLGFATLCGVLYVVYQSDGSTEGEYMLTVLFKSYLLFARMNADSNHYDVVALISLHDVQVERPDNGRARATQGQSEEAFTLPPIYSILVLKVDSHGHVFGLPGSLTRRLSIQRAATIHSRLNSCQVIIENTTTLQEDSATWVPMSIRRSKSLIAVKSIPILSPKRIDRLRMEASLAQVWTRDLLPYPGMSINRSEHTMRASASSVMRKFSKASITSSFSKRSVSATCLIEDRPGTLNTDLRQIEEAENEQDQRFYSNNCTGFTAARFVREGISKATNPENSQSTHHITTRPFRVETTDEGSTRRVKMINRGTGLLKTLSMEGLRSRRG
ncbi:MAG: hypothetical protein Q9214_001349 [Letrouitia sp. 1 TL-2023]